MLFVLFESMGLDSLYTRVVINPAIKNIWEIAIPRIISPGCYLVPGNL
jgi:hypothetical protein